MGNNCDSDATYSPRASIAAATSLATTSRFRDILRIRLNAVERRLLSSFASNIPATIYQREYKYTNSSELGKGSVTVCVLVAFGVQSHEPKHHLTMRHTTTV